MSNAPSTLDAPITEELSEDRLPDATGAARSALDFAAAPVRFAGFWSAVALPLAYLPMLAGGFAPGERSAFAVLLAAHALALVAGHGYRTD
ncbi:MULTISPECIES: hypothetical protein [Halorussus]|uniref:hypothetical protein n=1 Tax=Halorussus TaxID=1070314 RepID=UPI000E20F6CE|nr:MULTISPECIES: hypothetical protein [Halorussus]NHN59640.1 hypothetical protein [Halorussus sp. JP-T4]